MIKVPPGSVSGEGPLPDCLHAVYLCGRSLVHLWDRRPTLVTSFNLNDFLRGSTSKYSHIKG